MALFRVEEQTRHPMNPLKNTGFGFRPGNLFGVALDRRELSSISW